MQMSSKRLREEAGRLRHNPTGLSESERGANLIENELCFLLHWAGGPAFVVELWVPRPSF
jgi:hypothetical protein